MADNPRMLQEFDISRVTRSFFCDLFSPSTATFRLNRPTIKFDLCLIFVYIILNKKKNNCARADLCDHSITRDNEAE